MTASRLQPFEPHRPPETDPGALVDWARARDRLGFALRAAGRRPVLATACFLAIAALGPVSLAVMPRTYRVEAIVTASHDPVVSTLPDPVLLRPFGSEDPASVVRDAILRRDNLAALAEQTGLLQRWLEGRSPIGRARDRVMELLVGRAARREERLQDLVDLLEKKLTVSVPAAEPGAPPGAARDRIVIALEWPDGQMAKQLVDAAGRRFFESRREREMAMSRDIQRVLEERAREVGQDIEAKVTRIHELEVAMLRGHPSLARTYHAPRGRVPEEVDLTRLRVTLDSKKAALAELERFRQARSEELQAELARQRAAHAEQHPDVARAREVLERLVGPSPQAEALRAEIAGLEQEFAAASERAARLVDDEDPALEYERTDLRTLLARYQTLRDRLDGARVESAIAQAGFDRRNAFAVPAVVPRKPDKPIPALHVAAALLGGALLALFAAATLDLRSGRILERWQLERKLKVRVLGEFRA
jgi:hypothetical protein